MDHRSKPMRVAAALTGALLALTVGVAPGAEARPGRVAGAPPPVVTTGYIYVPSEGGRAVVRWNGKAAGYTLAKARAILPGTFDGVGGGVFVYRAGSAPDGILRIRRSGDDITFSFRKESVNGHFEPITGDFDGNGITDILWNEVAGPNSYLWLFRPDGSHSSRRFDTGFDGSVVRQADPADVNLDGITDLVWQGQDEVWIMQPDASHVARRIQMFATGYTGFVAGNVGPDDGVTRRRMVVVYEGGLERLITFNGAGQSTMKQLRSRTGSCCTYQGAVGGHFRSGAARSLYFYSTNQPNTTDYLQDITAGGNNANRPVPQVNGSYRTTVGDFDGNGFDDILFSNRTGATYLHSSDGTSFTTSNPSDIPPRSSVYAVTLSAP